jgi:hypothetical protein
METAVDKRYKFINGETGYVIFYHTLRFDLPKEKRKVELENVKKQVAIKNNILVSTIYWEEIKD